MDTEQGVTPVTSARQRLSAESSSAGTTKDSLVKLQVGERLFMTTYETLVGESDYFAALLSDRWNQTDMDGPRFIDADPDTFEHVLRYLRTANFPLFFDKASQSYDHAQYSALLGEARYFRIAKLVEWIESMRYLDAVRIEYKTEVLRDDNLIQALPGCYDTVKANCTLRFSFEWGIKKIYVCPRAIPAHRGHPDLCGMKCNKARGGQTCIFDDEPCLQGIVTRSKIIFDPRVCLGD
jgi:hypothetical protein